MTFNKIEVNMHGTFKHWVIVVDGTPLDVLIDQYHPTGDYLGLIPTILEWMYCEDEKELVKRRYTSTNREEILPVLMCPEDCEFFCTTIVVKVIKEDDYVIWEKVGVDQSEHNQLVGSKVKWLEKVPPMIFQRTEYELELNKIYT